MFSFFRRRKEADATARRIIDQGRFLGARTPREAVEMLWGRPLSENEWNRYASVWERIWQESLKESEMRPPYQLRLAISAVTDEPVSGKNATENAANAVALLTSAIVCNASHELFGHHGFNEQIFGADEQVSGCGQSD